MLLYTSCFLNTTVLGRDVVKNTLQGNGRYPRPKAVTGLSLEGDRSRPKRVHRSEASTTSGLWSSAARHAYVTEICETAQSLVTEVYPTTSNRATCVTTTNYNHSGSGLRPSGRPLLWRGWHRPRGSRGSPSAGRTLPPWGQAEREEVTQFNTAPRTEG